jgi:hypothetical protein
MEIYWWNPRGCTNDIAAEAIANQDTNQLLVRIRNELNDRNIELS